MFFKIYYGTFSIALSIVFICMSQLTEVNSELSLILFLIFNIIGSLLFILGLNDIKNKFDNLNDKIKELENKYRK